VIDFEKRRNIKHPKGMKVLILGGAGFIGSALSSHLYAKGDEVMIMDNLLYEKARRPFTPCRFIRGDIRNRRDLTSAIQRADAVVNLAALSNDPASDLDPALTWEINFEANKLIAEICRNYKKRVVYASSCSVYGFAESGIFNEESPLNPVSLYAKTKMLSEPLYLDSGLDSVVLRFATVYGYTPKPRFDLVVNTMIGSSYFNRRINVNGGNQWRPLVHVKDVARAIHCALHENNLKHRVYNVGSREQNYRIMDLAGIISRKFPGTEIIEEKDKADNRSYQVDFSRMMKDFGFQIQYTIDDAVEEFIEAFWKNEVPHMDREEYYRVKYLKNNDVLATIHTLGTAGLTGE